MTRLYKTTTLWAMAVFALANYANAQNGINSPYSRYGFGMMADRSMGFNKSMGGVAQGFRNGQQINAANPASYSAVDSLTALFDLGLSVYNGNYKMGNLQQNAKNSSFDYIAFQCRLHKGLGITIGLLPYTNIDYNFTSNAETIDGTSDNNITSSYAFNGSGGLHQAFVGIGWNVLTPISIGANIGYLYGDYTHTSTLSYNTTNAYSLVRGYSANIGTWKADFGIQGEFTLNKKDKITIGATYGLGHDIKNRAYRHTQTINSSSTVQSSTSDTLKNAFQLPHSLAFGVAYSHGTKWRVGADIELEKWSKSKFPSNIESSIYTAQKGQLNDRLRLSLGGEYTPNDLSRNYLSRITYKVGGYYQQSYAKTSANSSLSIDKPTEFGLTTGMSLPIQNRNIWYNSPRINITFGWIHTNIPYISNTSFEKSKLTENYLRLSIGITFSERWFYKWKVE